MTQPDPYSGQPQYPGQPESTGQPQYPGQQQYPGQPEFTGQPQYPGQPQYAGPPQPYGQPVAMQKSKTVAGLLGILIGSLGIHNFYLGKTNRGIIQIIVTFVTLGIGGIWGFIEGILILTSKPGTEWHRDAAGMELAD